ncbi:MAG: DUF2185 domain-containing protein [Chryseobacterium sp.]|nr:MAG: DUF2185 domain-containing protein [Chryseobacterium sp.]
MLHFFKKTEKSKTDKSFADSLSTAIFTTKFVMNDHKIITYVTHEAEDGAWQFFSDDEFENYEDVAMIVGLGEIVEKDKTVLEISDLPLGFIARRKDTNDSWKISKA